MLAYTARLSYRLGVSKNALERARSAEAQMAHVGRLAAMGEMSTTLAHELNQPLTAIVNYAHGIIRRLQADDLDRGDLLDVVQRIASEGHRSAEIIRRLREFLRKREPLHAPDDANRIVREAVELVRPIAERRQVDVRLALTDEPSRVLADAVQIEQVIVNIVHNAIEAINEADSRRREVIVATERSERGLDIIVRDSGPGVPAHIAGRLFEPFVTTKSDGMGIGLAISRSIVEAHGDRLRIVANPGGSGATFRFTLPE
jgi:C4-dicarboxylate-specific signal transduction histidine kinase